MKKPKPVHAPWQVDAARKYVDEQLAIMERFGSKPTMTVERYEKLVYDVLKHLPIGAKQPAEERNG